MSRGGQQHNAMTEQTTAEWTVPIPPMPGYFWTLWCAILGRPVYFYGFQAGCDLGLRVGYSVAAQQHAAAHAQTELEKLMRPKEEGE